MGYWLKSCWSFCVCVIHPCAGVLPFWVPYLPNPLTDFSIFGGLVAHICIHPTSQSVWQYHSSLWRYSLISVILLLPSVCNILSDLGIHSHNSHQTSHIFSHRYSASTIKIASHSEQPFLPTVTSTLCPHFVPYLLHLCC